MFGADRKAQIRGELTRLKTLRMIGLGAIAEPAIEELEAELNHLERLEIARARQKAPPPNPLHLKVDIPQPHSENKRSFWNHPITSGVLASVIGGVIMIALGLLL